MASSFSSNLGNFRIRVEQIAGRAERLINDAMEEGAKEIAATAKNMAPVDEKNLENAIQVRNEGRRRKWAVYVDETAPDNTGKYTIGDYLDFIHYGQYQLGEKSLAKNSGEIVGPRFMDRAYNQEIRGVIARVEQAARRGFGGI